MMIGEEEDVKRLFDYINLLNPTIEFTYEVSKDSVDFLDPTIHLNPFDKKLDFFLRAMRHGQCTVCRYPYVTFLSFNTSFFITLSKLSVLRTFDSLLDGIPSLAEFIFQ